MKFQPDGSYKNKLFYADFYCTALQSASENHVLKVS